MLVKSQARFVKSIPAKTRLVLDLIRNKDAQEAIAVLNFVNKRPKSIIAKILGSALATAKQKGFEPRQLYISKAVCNNGPIWKRFKAAAFGRATRIRRRTAHIIIELDLKT